MLAYEGHDIRWWGGVAACRPGAEACKFCLEIQEFALKEANTALIELKTRKIRGAKVLRVN